MGNCLQLNTEINTYENDDDDVDDGGSNGDDKSEFLQRCSILRYLTRSVMKTYASVIITVYTVHVRKGTPLQRDCLLSAVVVGRSV